MRPLETLLSAANFLAFFSLLASLTPSLPWMRFAAPLALLLVFVQTLLEGPRWQMVPAYALAFLFGSIWLLGSMRPMGLIASPWMRDTAAGLGLLALAISILLPVVLPVFHFRRPTGPYGIGTLTYHWLDPSRPELFTTEPNDHRELMVQIWYPARDDPAAPPAPYIEAGAVVTRAFGRLLHLPEFVFTHLAYVRTHAVRAAAVADDQTRYPVLIFLPGIAGFRGVNTFQIEELVSHGYIVAGLDQPGAVALVRYPDGRQVPGLFRDQIHPLIQQSVEPLDRTPALFGEPMPQGIVPYFAEDVPFTLDQLAKLDAADSNQILTGRLDLGRVGIFGISLGGINAAEACLKDRRLKACLIMDHSMSAGVVEAGLKQPAMWITRDAATMRLERERIGGWPEDEIAQHQETMRAVFEGLPGEGYFLQIPGMFHLNLTDAPYWSPLTSRIGLTGPVDGQRTLAIINAYSLAFFEKHLRGLSEPLLDGSEKPYPEVIFERRR